MDDYTRTCCNLILVACVSYLIFVVIFCAWSITPILRGRLASVGLAQARPNKFLFPDMSYVIYVTLIYQIKGSCCGLNVMYQLPQLSRCVTIQLPWCATTSHWNAYNYAITSNGITRIALCNR